MGLGDVDDEELHVLAVFGVEVSQPTG